VRGESERGKNTVERRTEPRGRKGGRRADLHSSVSSQRNRGG